MRSIASESFAAVMNRHIRVLIVDDNALVREGLRLTFDGTEIEVVAEAADGQAAFETLARQPVDVALVDIRMPGADGFHFLERMRDAGLGVPVVLMHSVNDGQENVRRCRGLGAKGLVTKGNDSCDLTTAIRRVHAGEHLWDIHQSA